jgi:putative peptidoglycan lipid II flippase
VLRLALPRIPGAMAYQFNAIVMTSLASLLSAGSITVFSFANDLQSFPINLIGVPFAVAAFPALSRAFAEKEKNKMESQLHSALLHVAALVLPLAAVIFLFRTQIVQLAYGMGNFDASSVRLTGALLGLFVLGVIFQALIPLLARAFFAMHDTKTPTVIGLTAVALNIVFSGLLVFLFSSSPFLSSFFASLLHLGQVDDVRVLALPLALFLSGLFQCGFLWLFLKKKLVRFVV